MKKLFIGFGVIVLFIAAYFIVDSILFDGVKPQRINQDGFQANYFAVNSTPNNTAIVIIGGGQWGDYWAMQFAKKGYIGLSLPYVGYEGLPKRSEEIPLEYFQKAIAWFGQQEAVNGDKVVIMGASRNAELALVLASTFPDLVSGVIAYSPSSVSWSNTVLPYNSDALKASWTYKGEDIAYVPMDKIVGNDSTVLNTLSYWQSGLEKAEQVRSASIKVEKINGPILLLSGKDDEVWPSALMADRIEERLIEKTFNFAFENVQYDNAGHLISRNPDSDSDTSVRTGKMNIKGKEYTFSFGGTMEGDNRAKKLARIKVFEFLEDF